MKKLILILLGLMPLSAAAQGWTLKDCIDYALENSITVRQADIAVKEREVSLNTAQMSRLPAVSGAVSENISFGRGLGADNVYENANNTGTSFNLGASVPIFQGFAINNQIAMQKLNLAAAEKDLERIKDDIRLAVAKGYIQVLYDMEILDVARSQVEIDSVQVDRLVAMKAAGKASEAQVAQQKSALGQSRYSETVSRNTLAMDLLDLSQLLELQTPEGFSVVRPSKGELDIHVLYSPEDIYADAVERRPAVKAEETRLQSAEKQIAYAKSQYYPSLMLSGGIGTNYYTSSRTQMSSFADQMKNNFSQSIGLTLSIPIFNRLATRNNVRMAELERRNMELEVELVKKSLYKEIQQAYYNALGAQSRYLSSMDAESSAKESYSLMLAKYENGKANITEFNEAKQAYLKSASDLAQARYEFLYCSRLLDFYKDGAISF